MDRRSWRRSSTHSSSSSSRSSDVHRRITRSLANSNQQANQEIGENVPDHLRYFYRSRHINMSNAIENAIENAIDNTIDNYEAMDIDEPEQMEISSEIMSRDNADTESNIMSIDQPLDVEFNSDGNEIEQDIHYDGEENDSDTGDENIRDHNETTNENEPQIINPNVFLPPDIKELLKSISRAECSSEQLGRLAGFFLILDRSVLNNWNLDLLIQKLLAIVQRTANSDSMPSIEALMLQQFEPEVLRQFLEPNMFQGTGNDPNVITMASRCLGNLVLTLGDSSERMVGRAIREEAVPVLCNILTEGPRTYDSEYLKDIIMALYNFSKPTLIDCTESIVKKDVFKNIMESILPFLIDEDRVLPLKLLANCTCKAPRRYIKKLLSEVFNTMDFQVLFADHEMPEVTKWCCVSLNSLISRHSEDVESLLVLSSPDVIRNITYRMKQFDEYNQLRMWKMFNILINKSRRITNTLIENGIVKALFDVFSRKSINNPEKDQNENELVNNVNPNPNANNVNVNGNPNGNDNGNGNGTERRRNVEDLYSELPIDSKTREIVTEVDAKLRYRYVNMEPIKLYMQVCQFILSLFPDVPDPGMLYLMFPDGKTNHKWSTEVDWLMEDIHHDIMTVDSDNTAPQSILNKQARLFAIVIIPSLFKAYRASECWELRKLIMTCILAFLIYYPEDLICKIFEYSHIEKFLSNIFFTSSSVKQKHEESEEDKDSIYIRDVRTYAEDLLIQIILRWNDTFTEVFEKECIHEVYEIILEKYQREPSIKEQNHEVANGIAE